MQNLRSIWDIVGIVGDSFSFTVLDFVIVYEFVDSSGDLAALRCGDNSEVIISAHHFEGQAKNDHI